METSPSSDPERPVAPDPVTARTLAALNILVSGTLLACGFGGAVATILYVMLAPGLSWTQHFRPMTSAISGYVAADLSTGIVLNIAFLIAGISLFRCQERGRQATLWLSGAKIVRLAIVYSLALTIVTPAYCRALAATLHETQRAAGAPQVTETVVANGLMLTFYTVGFMLVGMIYPCVCLWVLRGPAVKAACHAAPSRPSVP